LDVRSKRSCILNAYRSNSPPNDLDPVLNAVQGADCGSQQGQEDQVQRAPIWKNPKYQHVQSKYSATDKTIEKLRKEKLEVHEQYKVKKILQNERCGN